VIEVADILRLHLQSYQKQHSLGAFERKVLQALLDCRTAAKGGQLFECDHCGHTRYAYHSCQNRHCPKCQGQQTQRWLDKHREMLLNCDYFLLTFTLPSGLRSLARTHPADFYSILMSCAAKALQKLAWDPRYVGGQLGILAVLHTWTRALLYHPHVHLLVTAGGLHPKTQQWIPAANPAFLVPCFALSKIFAAKIKAALKKKGFLAQLPDNLWPNKWVVHCQHAGGGAQALDYLGRYVFRTAISNSRLEKFHGGAVTFRYRDNRTQELKHLTLPAEAFISRWLAHILPKGLVKVRSYGLWSSRNSNKLNHAKSLLPQPSSLEPSLTEPLDTAPSAATDPLCPKCKTGHLAFVEQILPRKKWPP